MNISISGVDLAYLILKIETKGENINTAPTFAWLVPSLKSGREGSAQV